MPRERRGDHGGRHGVFTRSDMELAAAMGAEIAARTSVGPEPGVLDVDVRDGVVRLCGTVERRSLAETIGAVARDAGGPTP